MESANQGFCVNKRLAPKRPILVLLFVFLALNFLTGCGANSALRQAQRSVLKSDIYYQRAVSSYKGMLASVKNKELAQIYFELGRLYYNHGDFKQAVEQFRKIKETDNIVATTKLLAISHYRLANFTDALEIFNKIKQELFDDESRYYHGLTCEKLNLYDQALDIYRKIKAPEFIGLAFERVNAIEKKVNPVLIKDLDPAVDKIIREAPPAQKYPQAGALILACDEKVEVTSDGRQVSSSHNIIKILNERGKENFSETHIEYDSTYEKVELEYARTIRPDGAVIDVGSRHIRDVSKYLNFPLYSNVRVCIISFPEIVEGAVVEYKLKVYRNQLINKKDFILHYSLQMSEPVISANFILDLPEGRILHIKALNDKYNNFGAKLEPAQQKVNGRLIYRWQFKDIPQIIPEANMPPGVEINPVILLSTFSSWQDIYDWWWKLAKDKMQADTAIKDKVKELTANLKSEEEKIRAISNFCAQKIRYVAVEYGQAGYEPHKAQDIFKNKYGDCKDQAVLLVTMLKEAGLLAYPVLIPTKEYYNLNEDFPSVMFNHCIAAVSYNKQLVFLDPTAETCPFGDLPGGDQNRKVLVFQEEGYKITNTPGYDAAHNLVKQDINIKVNSQEGITADKEISTYGTYNQGQRFWLLYTPPQLVEETLKEKIQEISIGAQLDSYEIKNLNDLNTPVTLSYKFNGREYFTTAGLLRIMPQLAGLDTSLVAKGKRDYPIDFGILDSKETTFNIDIPDNFIIKYMPESVIQDSRWMKFSVEYEYQNNRIFIRQKTELKNTKVFENEYEDFKKLYEGIAKKIKQRVILEKIDK